jgi:RNA polymerase sigma-70 factor (ECF subfamily)
VGTDADLLAAWRAGDTGAGELLVARHWASVSRFFRSKLGDDGADLISQTFLALVESTQPALRRDVSENVKAYLFTVARRRLADHFRTQAHHAADLSVASVVDLATGPAAQLSRRHRGELLHDALARIPVDDQIALELAYVEGLSTKEVADVLEIDENTVRSRLSLAREKLRAMLVHLGSESAAEAAESRLFAPVPR